MVYSRGGIPVGDYSADRVVNLGKGHGALDNGFGYTHISMKLPVLNSLAVSALTYNFLNPHTDYQTESIGTRIVLKSCQIRTELLDFLALGSLGCQLSYTIAMPPPCPRDQL
jgi:hypothetical protein